MQPLFLFKLLGIPFFSYTTLTVSGIVLALLAAVRGSAASQIAMPELIEVCGWIALPALLLGRALHIGYNANYYLERPGELLRFADGGLALVGLVAGGGIGLWLWCKHNRYPFAHMIDRAALSVYILATLSWLGAFLHGSQYGAPVDNLLALELRDAFGVISARWPTQLIAALWSACLGTVLVLCGVLRRNAQARQSQPATRVVAANRGEGFLSLVVYTVGMFALDFTRGDPSLMVNGLRLTQCLYLVLCLWGLLYVARTNALT